jgi:hypothetical protein
MKTILKPLEWLIPYTDPKDKMMVWVALDKLRLFKFVDGKPVIKKTTFAFRSKIEPMREITFEDVKNIWRVDYRTIDAFVNKELDYLGHQDETLNNTNRGYLTHGDDDDEVQNILLRRYRVNLSNYET